MPLHPTVRSSAQVFLAGILTALTQPNPDALRQAIRETKKLTSNPFGVNITLLPTINPPDYEGYARAAVEEGVKIFETAGNNRMWWLVWNWETSLTRPLSSWTPDKVLQVPGLHRVA